MQLIKRSSLYTSVNVGDTLTWKLDMINADKTKSNMVMIRMADYIGDTVGSIEAEQAYIKEAMKLARERVKSLEAQIRLIKIEGAEWLNKLGIDRLDGSSVSSVTINEGMPTSTKQKFMTDLTKKEIEELIITSGLGYYDTVDIPSTKDTLRVNKRKIALAEVEE